MILSYRKVSLSSLLPFPLSGIYAPTSSGKTQQNPKREDAFSVSAAPLRDPPRSNKLKKNSSISKLPLHEYITRGWDMTNDCWRDPVWPELDRDFRALREEVGTPMRWELRRSKSEVDDQASSSKGKGKEVPRSNRAKSSWWMAEAKTQTSS